MEINLKINAILIKVKASGSFSPSHSQGFILPSVAARVKFNYSGPPQSSAGTLS